MIVIISAPNSTRRAFLCRIYCAEHCGKFKYDGNFVCSNFFIESFRFGRDLQELVNKDMSEDITEEAQMTTLRSYSQERT